MIKLTDIRKKLPFKISKGISDLDIKDIVFNKHQDIEMDFDVYLPSIGKNLQRPLVWTNIQKSELIISILKGIQLANISIIKYRKHPGDHSMTIYKVIDGKQRLTTIISFIKNEFPFLWKDKFWFFKDLDEDAQLAIFNLDLRYDIAYEYDYDMIQDSDKINWFELINFAGTPQDIVHLNNLKK